MSAWLCSPKHINALVNAYAENKAESNNLSKHQLKGLVHVLFDANIRSLVARYGKRAEEDGDKDDYVFKKEAVLDPFTIRTLCRCYDYQSCESPDYKPGDKAHDIVQALERASTEKIVNTHPGKPKDLPWGI